MQGAVDAYAWQASVERAGAVVGTSVVAAMGPLIQQSSLWRSEGQDEETSDEAGLKETVRFVHEVAGRVTGSGEGAPDAQE